MKRHAKRLTAPRTIKIPRKKQKFIAKSSPGPHDYENSLPLLVVVRDILALGKNSREAKKIIRNGKVLVDSRVRKDPEFPVGLADIISIPDMDLNNIVMMDRRERLALREIGKKASQAKLYSINNKSLLKGGNLQLNLHDGTNLLIPVKDPSRPEEDTYNTKDSIVVTLKTKKIKEQLRYREGSMAFLTGGSHKGQLATIKKIQKNKSFPIYTT